MLRGNTSPVTTRSRSKCKRQNLHSSIVNDSNNENISLQIGEHDKVYNTRFNVKQLKNICRSHKLKVSGSKEELINRIYTYLRESLYARHIQRWWRTRLVDQCVKLRGPANLKREICVNETDFYSMEPINIILPQQFISYKCSFDNKVYGFNINSIYKLLSNGSNLNPYTRESLPTTMRANINRLLCLSALTNQKIEFGVDDDDDENKLTPTKKLELSIINLFHTIDSYGNITNHMWFWGLCRVQLIRFIRELADIWSYRAQLQDSIKREICPPNGLPFSNIDIQSLPLLQIEDLRQSSMIIMKNFITSGTNIGSRSLGANYVLCALSLVSSEAANAMPWFFHAVSDTF